MQNTSPRPSQLRCSGGEKCKRADIKFCKTEFYVCPFKNLYRELPQAAMRQLAELQKLSKNHNIKLHIHASKTDHS
ncbi:MAG: hypothetical protein AAF849_25300, partial [Bacteroidota bacterium]